MRQYYCHQCERSVVVPAAPAEVNCPLCNGGFVEELPDDPISNNNNNNPFLSGGSPIFPDPFSFLTDPTTTTTTTGRGPVLFTSTTFLSSSGQPTLSIPLTHTHTHTGFDPFTFLQSYLDNNNFQFVLNPTGDPSATVRPPPNFGDYFMGPGLEQLMQYLAENDPNRYGTPPASKSVVDGLPTVTITDDVVNSEANACAVCMTEFEAGGEAKQLPCKHLYHSDCILPWLQLHNSCPVCRFELPTDDKDYEDRKASGGASQGGDGGAGTSAGAGGDRAFRISLPWPFNQFVGRGDDNAGGNSGGDGTGGSSSGGGDPHFEAVD